MLREMPTAVVTGAGRGVGRAICSELAGRGYDIFATDIEEPLAADTAAALCVRGRPGPEIDAVSAKLDVRDEAECRGVASSCIEEFGALDLWVNNAGVLITGNAWEQDGSARKAMLDINALGTMNGTLAALDPMMSAGRGHVVNIVSLAGLVAAPGEVAYAASKHAALAFTLGTLFDLRRAGVRGVHLSAVCPDGIWTPMLNRRLADPGAAGSFSGKLLTAEEVAAEVGELTERPRPLLTIPRWRGAMVRLFDAMPGAMVRLTPLVMKDAERRQRRYKRLIESGRWPKRD